jgi:hypothetical protein
VEWRIFVPHEGNVGDNAVDPAVQAKQEVEEPPPVLAREQQDHAGDQDQQPQE